MVPDTTFTVIVVGDVKGFATVPLFRVKLMLLPIGPLGGETVNAPLPTPGVVTVVVNVPDPEVVLVPV